MADSYTKLLLHFNGNDGANSTHDSSKSNHPISFYGNAQLDTAHHMFDTESSLKLDGNDNLRIPSHNDWNFGSSAFTLEVHARMQSVPPDGGRYVLIERWWPDYAVGYNGDWYFDIKHDYGTNFHLIFAFTTDGWETTRIVMNSDMFYCDRWRWYHFAVARSGNYFRFFVDGKLRGTRSAAGTICNDPIAPSIGLEAQTGTFGFNGWIDEFRVSKGIARWTSSFGVPTEEYDTLHLPGQLSAAVSLSGSLKGITVPLIGWSYPELMATGKLSAVVSMWGTAFPQLSVSPAQLSGIIIDLSGFVVGSSSVAAVIALGGIAVSLEGLTVCNSFAGGELRGMAIPLTGAISAQSTVTAGVGVIGPPLHIVREIEGAVEAESAVVCLVSRTRRLATTVTVSSSVTGRLAVELVGTVTSESSTSGALDVTRKLVGTITCQCSVRGKLYISLRGSIVASSSVTGAVKVTRKLTVTVTPLSSVAGLVGVEWKLVGVISPGSNVGGRVSISRRVTGQVSCSSSITGNIIPFKMLLGAISVQSTVWCSYHLLAKKKLVGTITTRGRVTGQVTRFKSLAATVSAESTLVATLSMEAWLAGSVTPTSVVVGHLVLEEALRVRIRSYSLLYGSLSVSWQLIGVISAESIVNGVLGWRYPHFIIASATVSPVFAYTLTVTPTLEVMVANLPTLEHTVDVLPPFTSMVTGLPILAHGIRVNEKLKLREIVNV